MPLKTKSTPILNSNMLVTRPQNALGFSVDETARSTLASKLLFKSQNNQTSINTKEQLNLYLGLIGA